MCTFRWGCDFNAGLYFKEHHQMIVSEFKLVGLSDVVIVITYSITLSILEALCKPQSEKS